MTKDEFVNRSAGLPWADRSQTWAEMDCWGLVVMYYRHVLMVELPDVHAMEFGDGMCAALDSGLFKQVDEPVSDGVIFTSFDPRSGAPCHVGVAIDSHHVLHSNHGAGVRCDKLALLKRIYGRLDYYAFTGCTDRS